MENSAVAWFGLEEAVAASSEPWFRERIYRKLNAKLALFSRGTGDVTPLQLRGHVRLRCLPQRRFPW